MESVRETRRRGSNEHDMPSSPAYFAGKRIEVITRRTKLEQGTARADKGRQGPARARKGRQGPARDRKEPKSMTKEPNIGHRMMIKHKATPRVGVMTS